jgi:hypothetical protein
MLYYPEAVPVLQPLLPPSFNVDIERVRQFIVETRPI